MIQKSVGLTTMNVLAINTISRVQLQKFKQSPLSKGMNLLPNLGEMPSLTDASLQHVKGGVNKSGGTK